MRLMSSTCKAASRTSTPKSVQLASSTPRASSKVLSYHRLVIATGSRLFRPNIPGLAEHGFSVDNLDDAITLDRHLHRAGNDARPPRRATLSWSQAPALPASKRPLELPSRLRTIFGKNANPRVIIVDRNSAVAPDMGEGPRPIIEEALRKIGVETRLNAGVSIARQVRYHAEHRRACIEAMRP